MERNSRILITGGAGFIGFHLSKALLSSGYRVRCLDNLSAGSSRNIADLQALSTGRYESVEGSVCDEGVVESAMKEVDWIFHLAAAVGVRRVHEDPLGTIEANVRGSEVVLAAASRHGTPVFLASSSEVYGRSPREMFHESDDLVIGSPHVGRWSYAASKVLDEFLALAYHRERGLPVVIGRFFNTVGPRQPVSSGMVIPLLVSQALAGEPVVVFGDGRQARCFAHVDDVVSDLIGLMTNPGSIGEIFNLGHDHPTSIRDLAAQVVEVTGSQSGMVVSPHAEVFDDSFEDIQRRRPDLRRVRELLGPRESRTLKVILEEVVAWMREEASVGVPP